MREEDGVYRRGTPAFSFSFFSYLMTHRTSGLEGRALFPQGRRREFRPSLLLLHVPRFRCADPSSTLVYPISTQGGGTSLLSPRFRPQEDGRNHPLPPFNSISTRRGWTTPSFTLISTQEGQTPPRTLCSRELPRRRRGIRMYLPL